MKNLLLSLVVAACAVFATNNASAQSPSGAFGLGASLGAEFSALHLAYALDPAIHIGTAFGLTLRDGSNVILFAPYGKFLLKGSKEFKPYAQVQFIIASGGGSTQTALNVSGGAEYFITPNFGLFGQISVLNAGFGDGGVTSFGVMTPRLGVEWFMD